MNIRNLYRPILLSLVIAATALYLAMLFVPVRTLIQLGNYTLIWIAAAVTIAYVAGVVPAIMAKRPDALAYLTVGVVMSWLSVFLNRTWATGLRNFPDAAWMRTYWIIPAYILIAVLAGSFHLLAGGAIDGRVPRRNWVWLGLVVGGGFATTALIIGMGYGETGF